MTTDTVETGPVSTTNSVLKPVPSFSSVAKELQQQDPQQAVYDLAFEMRIPTHRVDNAGVTQYCVNCSFLPKFQFVKKVQSIDQAWSKRSIVVERRFKHFQWLHKRLLDELGKKKPAGGDSCSTNNKTDYSESESEEEEEAEAEAEAEDAAASSPAIGALLFSRGVTSTSDLRNSKGTKAYRAGMPKFPAASFLSRPDPDARARDLEVYLNTLCNGILVESPLFKLFLDDEVFLAVYEATTASRFGSAPISECIPDGMEEYYSTNIDNSKKFSLWLRSSVYRNLKEEASEHRSRGKKLMQTSCAKTISIQAEETYTGCEKGIAERVSERERLLEQMNSLKLRALERQNQQSTAVRLLFSTAGVRDQLRHKELADAQKSVQGRTTVVTDAISGWTSTLQPLKQELLEYLAIDTALIQAFKKVTDDDISNLVGTTSSGMLEQVEAAETILSFLQQMTSKIDDEKSFDHHVEHELAEAESLMQEEAVSRKAKETRVLEHMAQQEAMLATRVSQQRSRKQRFADRLKSEGVQFAESEVRRVTQERRLAQRAKRLEVQRVRGDEEMQRLEAQEQNPLLLWTDTDRRADARAQADCENELDYSAMDADLAVFAGGREASKQIAEAVRSDLAALEEDDASRRECESNAYLPEELGEDGKPLTAGDDVFLVDVFARRDALRSAMVEENARLEAERTQLKEEVAKLEAGEASRQEEERLAAEKSCLEEETFARGAEDECVTRSQQLRAEKEKSILANLDQVEKACAEREKSQAARALAQGERSGAYATYKETSMNRSKAQAEREVRQLERAQRQSIRGAEELQRVKDQQEPALLLFLDDDKRTAERAQVDVDREQDLVAVIADKASVAQVNGEALRADLAQLEADEAKWQQWQANPRSPQELSENGTFLEAGEDSFLAGVIARREVLQLTAPEERARLDAERARLTEESGKLDAENTILEEEAERLKAEMCRLEEEIEARKIEDECAARGQQLRVTKEASVRANLDQLELAVKQQRKARLHRAEAQDERRDVAAGRMSFGYLRGAAQTNRQHAQSERAQEQAVRNAKELQEVKMRDRTPALVFLADRGEQTARDAADRERELDEAAVNADKLGHEAAMQDLPLAMKELQVDQAKLEEDDAAWHQWAEHENRPEELGKNGQPLDPGRDRFLVGVGARRRALRLAMSEQRSRIDAERARLEAESELYKQEEEALGLEAKRLTAEITRLVEEAGERVAEDECIARGRCLRSAKEQRILADLDEIELACAERQKCQEARTQVRMKRKTVSDARASETKTRSWAQVNRIALQGERSHCQAVRDKEIFTQAKEISQGAKPLLLKDQRAGVRAQADQDRERDFAAMSADEESHTAAEQELPPTREALQSDLAKLQEEEAVWQRWLNNQFRPEELNEDGTCLEANGDSFLAGVIARREALRLVALKERSRINAEHSQLTEESKQLEAEKTMLCEEAERLAAEKIRLAEELKAREAEDEHIERMEHHRVGKEQSILTRLEQLEFACIRRQQKQVRRAAAQEERARASAVRVSASLCRSSAQDDRDLRQLDQGQSLSVRSDEQFRRVDGQENTPLLYFQEDDTRSAVRAQATMDIVVDLSAVNEDSESHAAAMQELPLTVEAQQKDLAQLEKDEAAWCKWQDNSLELDEFGDGKHSQDDEFLAGVLDRRNALRLIALEERLRLDAERKRVTGEAANLEEEKVILRREAVRIAAQKGRMEGDKFAMRSENECFVRLKHLRTAKEERILASIERFELSFEQRQQLQQARFSVQKERVVASAARATFSNNRFTAEHDRVARQRERARSQALRNEEEMRNAKAQDEDPLSFYLINKEHASVRGQADQDCEMDRFVMNLDVAAQAGALKALLLTKSELQQHIASLEEDETAWRQWQDNPCEPEEVDEDGKCLPADDEDAFLARVLERRGALASEGAKERARLDAERARLTEELEEIQAEELALRLEEEHLAVETASLDEETAARKAENECVARGKRRRTEKEARVVAYLNGIKLNGAKRQQLHTRRVADQAERVRASSVRVAASQSRFVVQESRAGRQAERWQCQAERGEEERRRAEAQEQTPLLFFADEAQRAEARGHAKEDRTSDDSAVKFDTAAHAAKVEAVKATREALQKDFDQLEKDDAALQEWQANPYQKLVEDDEISEASVDPFLAALMPKCKLLRAGMLQEQERLQAERAQVTEESEQLAAEEADLAREAERLAAEVAGLEKEKADQLAENECVRRLAKQRLAKEQRILASVNRSELAFLKRYNSQETRTRTQVERAEISALRAASRSKRAGAAAGAGPGVAPKSPANSPPGKGRPAVISAEQLRRAQEHNSRFADNDRWQHAAANVQNYSAVKRNNTNQMFSVEALQADLAALKADFARMEEDEVHWHVYQKNPYEPAELGEDGQCLDAGEDAFLAAVIARRKWLHLIASEERSRLDAERTRLTEESEKLEAEEMALGEEANTLASEMARLENMIGSRRTDFNWWVTHGQLLSGQEEDDEHAAPTPSPKAKLAPASRAFALGQPKSTSSPSRAELSMSKLTDGTGLMSGLLDEIIAEVGEDAPL